LVGAPEKEEIKEGPPREEDTSKPRGNYYGREILHTQPCEGASLSRKQSVPTGKRGGNKIVIKEKRT